MNLGWAITYDANGEIVHACDESHDYRDQEDLEWENFCNAANFAESQESDCDYTVQIDQDEDEIELPF